VEKILRFLKEYKKVFLVPLILMVVITLIILVIAFLSQESNFKYLGWIFQDSSNLFDCS